MAGGGRRKRTTQKKNSQRARQSAKDHPVHSQNESPLSEELMALSSIFQEDFTLISEDSSTEFSIALHPHSGSDGTNVSADLHVRCLPGYPYKPPKLQVKSNEGLSEEDLHLLHSLLVDQASLISREGRVMVYNLVEAAQEFLSEHFGSDLLQEHEENQEASTTVDDSWAVVSNSTACTLQDIEVPPVYGVVDLFTELGDESHWKAEPHQPLQKRLENFFVGNLIGSVGRRDTLAAEELNTLVLNKATQRPLSDLESKTVKQQVFKASSNKLTVLHEKEDNVSFCKSMKFSSVCELLENVYGGLNSTRCKNAISMDQGSAQSALSSSEESNSHSKCLSLQDKSEDSVRKDFLLAHLLRLVCCPRGPLPNAWPALARQLQKLDVR